MIPSRLDPLEQHFSSPRTTRPVLMTQVAAPCSLKYYIQTKQAIYSRNHHIIYHSITTLQKTPRII
jgi:hypothetical protein